METTKEKLTIRDICALLENEYQITVKYRTVSSWLTKGHLRGKKEHQPILNSDIWLVDIDEVRAAIEENRVPPKMGHPRTKESEHSAQ